MIVQDYRDAAGRSVSLEIFEMVDPGAAYGIFSFKRSGEGRSLALGAAGELEDYYLNFWKGCFVATLTGFDETEATVAGLLALGRAVDAKIGQTAEAPTLVAALPGEGLKAGSVKYLRGLLGLNNTYSFFLGRGLAFKAAVKGDYGDGTTLIVLDYGSAAERAADWSWLQEALGSSDKFERTGGDGQSVPVYRDRKGRYLAFGQAGARLVVGLGPDAAAAVAASRRAGL